MSFKIEDPDKDDHEEFKLEYSDLHKQFSAEFESHLERLIAECNISPEQFFDALKKIYYTNEHVKFYVEIILGVVDIDNFVTIMKKFSNAPPA